MSSPYKFLDFYGFLDSEIFFGREREINILLSDVLVNRLVVLFARTGTGKTSLINAGVRPVLEDRGFQTFYIRVENDPTRAARDELRKKKMLRENAAQTSLAVQLQSVVELLNKPIVLFFDQFEEFFIQIRQQETRRGFISDVATIYSDVDSGVHMVFSMREEYFHEMDEFREEIPSIFDNNSNLRLLPFDEEQAHEAIVNPAGTSRADPKANVAEAVVTAIIRDLTTEDGVLPTQLQIVCDTLWNDEARSTKKITLDDYRRLGGAYQILERRLEGDITKELSKTSLLPLLQRLIPALRTVRNTKYPRAISELESTLKADPQSLSELISRLEKIHVIRKIHISGAPAIEWASDYLAERTDYLLTQVASIELKRLIGTAIATAENTHRILQKKQSSGDGAQVPSLTDEQLDALYLPLEDLRESSKNVAYATGLDTEEVLFLFDAALFHGEHMFLWYAQLEQRNANPIGILHERIHGKEVHINISIGALHLLKEIGSEQAIALLGQALDEPDLALEAMDLLVESKGDQATKFLANALNREELWETVLFGLKRVGTERAVTLLEPLLQQADKSLQVLSALEHLTRSTTGQTGAMAVNALVRAVSFFEMQLKDEHRSAQAQAVLERLANSTNAQIQTLANQALDRSRTPETRAALLDSISPPVEALEPRHGILERIISVRNIAKIVPVISGSFRINQIFQRGGLEEELARTWAQILQYPFDEQLNFPRAAQYYSVLKDSSEVVKEEYLNFMKRSLLEMKKQEQGQQEAALRLRNDTNQRRFSDIVNELGSPQFPTDLDDPLRLLAQLPLPIYVTTSYFDFLERELRSVGKLPQSQVISWERNAFDRENQYAIDSDIKPTVDSPAVYHLYGIEDNPETMVLTEDDYLKYLMNISQDMDTRKPIIPARLRKTFVDCHLLFLGYRQQDWEFQALFRLILKDRGSLSSDTSKVGIFVQPMPRKEARSFSDLIQRYFARYRFEVEWKTSEQFVQNLWDLWKNQMG